MEIKSPFKSQGLCLVSGTQKGKHQIHDTVEKALQVSQSHWCILCMGSGELIDHLFLHYHLTLGFWHKFFNLAKMDWVPSRSICDMITTSIRGSRSSIKGKTLWQITCLTILWIVWRQKHARIFEEKWRTEKMLLDLLHFYSSLWTSYTIAFKGILLNVIQLNWLSVGNLKGGWMRGIESGLEIYVSLSSLCLCVWFSLYSGGV